MNKWSPQEQQFCYFMLVTFVPVPSTRSSLQAGLFLSSEQTIITQIL